MSCKECNKVVDNTDSGIDYRVREGISSIQANNGSMLRVTEPAIARPHQPRRGWQVRLTINGQSLVVPGKSALEVRNAAERLLVQNGIKVSPKDLWFNLNVQWLRRTPEKYQLVDLGRYLALAVPQERVFAEKHTKRRWAAADWLEKALWLIGAYLSGDDYDRSRFLSSAEMLLVLCDPLVSPVTGSAKVFSPLFSQVSILTKSPAFNRDDARTWLVETLLILPLPESFGPVTVEGVANKYHWT
jgi:hypothetical protein